MLDVSNIQTLVTKEFNRGDLILASKYNELLKSLETIANYCNCNCNYCGCDCNYCTCVCNYCTCNCAYCPCNVNY